MGARRSTNYGSELPKLSEQGWSGTGHLPKAARASGQLRAGLPKAGLRAGPEGAFRL